MKTSELSPEEAAFFTLYSGLPREGPGSDASTLKSFGLLPPLPAAPRVVDVGCGPGKQTLVLARALKVPIVAVDTHQPYLDQLRQAADAEGLTDYVETRKLSMDALDFPAESLDLIWGEGCLYILGVQRALGLWRPLLRARGWVVFTELTWLADEPPAEAKKFFKEAYPPMGTIAENIGRVEAEGFEVFDHFTLPPEDWWTEYYTPLQQRMALLRPEAERNPELAAVLDETEREIDIYTRYGESFGYVFFLTRKREPKD